jgi:hypothetical protein
MNQITELSGIPDEVVMNKIFLLRRKKVMLDEDLAELYGVETRRLNEQVKRNPERFPEDFMFQLNDEEFTNLMSQNATSSWGGRRKNPFAFTEHGVLMLSSVLNSERAIKVNIQIMRVYIRIREMIMLNRDILQKFEGMERQLSEHDNHIIMIFKYLKQLELVKKRDSDTKNRAKVGYKQNASQEN